MDMKVAVIFGISSSLGEDLLKKLEDLNIKVIGIYNKNEVTNCEAYKCDITNEEEVKNTFNIIKEKYNKVDYLINYASISIDNEIEDKSLDEFMRVLKTNLGGTYLINKYFANILDNGVVINISSTDGIDTFSPISMDYCASKAGINNLTANMALAYPNIKFYALAPNWIDTTSTRLMEKHYLESELKRINQDRLLTVDEVNNKIIELLDGSITSGSVIRMD